MNPAEPHYWTGLQALLAFLGTGIVGVALLWWVIFRILSALVGAFGGVRK